MNLPPLTVARDTYRPDVTFGKLEVDGRAFCEILELPDKGNAPDISCIPCGVYRYRVTYSPKFKRPLIELSGVPGRFKIRMHAGNTTDDTQGCQIYGTRRGLLKGKPAVLGSRTKEDELMARLSPILADNPEAEGIIEVRDSEDVGRAA